MAKTHAVLLLLYSTLGANARACAHNDNDIRFAPNCRILDARHRDVASLCPRALRHLPKPVLENTSAVRLL